MSRALLFAGLLVAVSCSTMPSKREVCGNAVDDDSNGLIDCADPECVAKPECDPDAGFYGSCPRCGLGCSKQQECLAQSFFNDVPLPTCENARCTAFNAAVQVDVILNAQNAWGTLINPTRSIITRFVKRRAVDGSPVTCSILEAAAPRRTAADARQLEESGKFLYQGIDSRPINMGSGSIPLRLLNVVTGGEYLVWMEMWGGPPDGATKFPTGNRLGYECFDGPASGQQWSPIVASDDCGAGADAGRAVCRQFQVTATLGPQP